MQARTLLLLVIALAGCDSSAAFEDCDNPDGASGSRHNACPESVFQAENFRGREVGGVVRRGEDVVPGATVRIEPTAGFASGKAAGVVSTITDSVGMFAGLRSVAFRYDLFARLDAAGSAQPDVIVFRGLGGRFVEPALEGPRTFSRAWSSRVELKLMAPVPSDRSLAFYASGDGVYGVTADATNGLAVLTRDYTSAVTLHILEYPTCCGLENATAYAKEDLQVTASATRLLEVALQRIEDIPRIPGLSPRAEPKFEVTAPPGFTPSAVEIRLGYTRTSDALLASIPIGTSRSLPVIPNASFTYRVVATNAEGVTTDTGENGFDIYSPLTAITLPAPPAVTTPKEMETRGPGDLLVIDGPGIFEHVLVPQGEDAGRPSIRVISAERETALPDVSVVGAARAIGLYTWTVRSYPKSHFVEELSGIDSRRYRGMTVSRPRSIVLR